MLKDMFKKTYTLIDTKYKKASEEKEEVSTRDSRIFLRDSGANAISAAGPSIQRCEKQFLLCPKCDGYFRVHAYRRIEMTIDSGSFEEWDREMEFVNPLNFPGYEKKVQAVREKTNLNEAVVTGRGNHSWSENSDRRLRFPLHYEQHEPQCRREDCESCGEGYGSPPSGDYLCLFRRSQDAGGACVPDADGKDLCGNKTPQ